MEGLVMSERSKNNKIVLASMCPKCRQIFVHLTNDQLRIVEGIKDKGYYNYEAFDETGAQKFNNVTKSGKVVFMAPGRGAPSSFLFRSTDDTSALDHRKLTDFTRNIDLLKFLKLTNLRVNSELKEYVAVDDAFYDYEKARYINKFQFEFTDDVITFEEKYGMLCYLKHNQFDEMTNCPICGNDKSLFSQCYYENATDSSVVSVFEKLLGDKTYSTDEILGQLRNEGIFKPSGKGILFLASEMQNDVLNKEKLSLVENTSERIKKELDADERSKYNSELQKSGNFDLSMFLECAIDSEKQKRFLCDLLDKQIKIFCDYSVLFNQKKMSIYYKRRQQLTKSIADIQEEIKLKKNSRIVLTNEDLESNGIKIPVEPIKPIQPQLNKPTFFNKKKCEEKNRAFMEKYREDEKCYNFLGKYQILSRQKEQP
jgi:hypothetical protein